MPRPVWPPEPPFEMPPGRTLMVPGRGEMFLRDTGGEGPVVMLLHGWMATADLNWCAQYQALADAGYRVLAIDHRGHGRGLRSMARFQLVDCAADAAEVLRQLGGAPAIVVGYSMGGAIAQLVARDHPDVVGGLVLSGTAQHWQDPQSRRTWKAMGAWGMILSVAPRATWRSGLHRVGLRESAPSAWLLGELMRHSARDMADAGRELGRFDSRPWLGNVSATGAVVITTGDDMVRPSNQYELAQALGAAVFEAPVNHIELISRASDYNPALLAAIAAVGSRERVQVA